MQTAVRQYTFLGYCIIQRLGRREKQVEGMWHSACCLLAGV